MERCFLKPVLSRKRHAVIFRDSCSILRKRLHDLSRASGWASSRLAEAPLLVAISGRPEVMEISAVQKNFLSYSYSYPELFSSDILSRSFGAAASGFIRFVARVEIPLCSFARATDNLPLSETGSCCTVSSVIRSSCFMLKYMPLKASFPLDRISDRLIGQVPDPCQILYQTNSLTYGVL